MMAGSCEMAIFAAVPVQAFYLAAAHSNINSQFSSSLFIFFILVAGIAGFNPIRLLNDQINLLPIFFI